MKALEMIKLTELKKVKREGKAKNKNKNKNKRDPETKQEQPASCSFEYRKTQRFVLVFGWIPN